MYKFPFFTEEDNAKVLAFMEEHPFAVLTGSGSNYPVATHVPVAIELKEDGRLFLYGHIMKKTDHHLAFEKNDRVLVIFNGPHAYISASWYANPQSASTWNYLAVHATGRITFTDEQGTIAAIRAVTERFEGVESAASFDRLPGEYVLKLVKAICGFSIEVESLDNVFKLSQNHDEVNRKSIITHLRARGDCNAEAIAKEMSAGIPADPAH
jgi:transcriptional regulator